MSGPLFTAQSHNGATVRKEVKRRQWTRDEERELSDLYQHGYSPLRISRIMCRSVGSINAKLDYMLVTRKNTYRAWNIQEIRKAQRLRAEGKTFADIAREIGRSATSVRHAVIEAERRAA